MTDANEKLLIFTDIHLVNDGDDIIGLDPAARFREGLEPSTLTQRDWF